MSKRDKFIEALRSSSLIITDTQRIKLLQQAVQDYGLSMDEASEILNDLGLVVGEDVNYFEVLGLSIEEIRNLDEHTIKTLVEAAHKEHYRASLQAGGRVRADGKTEEQWRNILNQARDTLKDSQKRREYLNILSIGKNLPKKPTHSLPPSKKESQSPEIETLIRIDNLHKSFYDGESELKVLKGVNLDVHKSEILVIMGASGVGKSTLLHIIGTLDRPTEGSIFYDEQDITTFSESELTQFRNDAIGFVFQFHQMLPEFTALENVVMSRLIRNSKNVGAVDGKSSNTHEAYQDAENLLESVGLSERLKHYPSQLSGGERQRVAIARALMNNPKVVLADEPTGNIDDKTSEAVLDLLLEVNEQLNQTFIIVTHDSRISERAKRTVHLVDGRIAK